MSECPPSAIVPADFEAIAQQPLRDRAELLTAFADFLHVDVGAGDAAADTIRTYSAQLQQFLQWCDRSDRHPLDVTQREIKRYRRWLVESRSYKPATVALKLSVLRRFYDALIERELLSVNPALGIRAPREKRDPAERITYLERDELVELLAAIPDDNSLKALRDRALIAIMALEGPRTVEMHRANLADWQRQGRRCGIRVEGKRSIRIVPLTDDIAALLQHYLTSREAQGDRLVASSPLFAAVGNRAGGKRLTRRGIRQVVDGYLQQAGLKHRDGRTLSTHSLRHTAGTLSLQAGADLRQVQDLLGHADPRTTATYAHVADRWQNNPARHVDVPLR
ncbi:site-specific recombinase XerD [Rubidibacter lacunae KORDI 51-2]|uniref:Site-specific recombinase XerD n=1 Tax=Rubidibacter lacunae KORDI 51-2 TaxID=582515 RepID=U5DJU3_9CHRO|nr:tyrosine-type recombinase/integrase [Rubidibacter lacunae]ERN40849.1 site-specific recombinase XerD [Rubidibacter lacunae KORDI 51-2]